MTAEDIQNLPKRSKDLGDEDFDTLSLGNTSVTDAVLKELAKLKQLRKLSLDSTDVTDDGLKELAGLGLEELTIPQNAKTDLGLKHYLAALQPPKMLDLSDWKKITDAGLKELAKLTELQTLNLSSTGVTDAGLKELAPLRNLHKLDLSNTQVTDAGLKELAKFTQLRNVVLHNIDPDRVTSRGVADLQEALPKCQILASVPPLPVQELEFQVARTLKVDYAVLCLAFSPDGMTLASAGGDGAVRLWDLAGGDLTILKGHENPIWCLAFSADGKVLLSASQGNNSDTGNVSPSTIKLWDVAARKAIDSFGASPPAVLSPDGKTPASPASWVDRDRHDIALWDVRTGHAKAILRGHNKGIRALALSPDGKVLASGGEDLTVLLWDFPNVADTTVVPQLRPRAILKGHEGNGDSHSGIQFLAFSPNGKTLASGTSYTIKLWDVQRKDWMAQIKMGEFAQQLSCLAFHPDGKTLATGSTSVDGVQLWDTATGKQKALLKYEARVGAVAFSPDGKLLATVRGSSKDVLKWPTEIKLWDVSGLR